MVKKTCFVNMMLIKHVNQLNVLPAGCKMKPIQQTLRISTKRGCNYIEVFAFDRVDTPAWLGIDSKANSVQCALLARSFFIILT